MIFEAFCILIIIICAFLGFLGILINEEQFQNEETKIPSEPSIKEKKDDFLWGPNILDLGTISSKKPKYTFTCLDCKKKFKTKNGSIWHSTEFNHSITAFDEYGNKQIINPEKNILKNNEVEDKKLTNEQTKYLEHLKEIKKTYEKNEEDNKGNYNLKYYTRKYDYRYNFSDRKVEGLTVGQTLEVVSGAPFLCFSPITTAVFCWVNRNKKKVKNTYRKDIKNEIDLYLSDRVSYKYISSFILELYGNTNYEGIRMNQKNDKLVEASFRYSKKMLRRIVLMRKGISPQEATLEFKKSAEFKKSTKLLKTLEKKIKFLGNCRIRMCDKCRLIGIEHLWFNNFTRKGQIHYTDMCKICK